PAQGGVAEMLEQAHRDAGRTGVPGRVGDPLEGGEQLVHAPTPPVGACTADAPGVSAVPAAGPPEPGPSPPEPLPRAALPRPGRAAVHGISARPATTRRAPTASARTARSTIPVSVSPV